MILGSNTQPETKETPSCLQKTRDFVFSTLAFPVGIFTTISFWSIYCVDRNLIWPTLLDNFYPLWVNHMVHTTCLLSQLIEIVTVHHVYPSTKSGILTTIGFYLTYLVWILFLAFRKDVWIYPVLQKLSPIGRTLFIAAFGVLGGVLFMAGKFLNQKIWGNNTKKETRFKVN